MGRRGMWSGLRSDSAPLCCEYAESSVQRYSPWTNRSVMRSLAERSCIRSPVMRWPDPSPAETTSKDSMTRSPRDSTTVPGSRPRPGDETRSRGTIGLGWFSAQVGSSWTPSCHHMRVLIREHQRVSLERMVPEGGPVAGAAQTAAGRWARSNCDPLWDPIVRRTACIGTPSTPTSGMRHNRSTMPAQFQNQADHTRHTREVYDRLAPVWSKVSDDGPFNGWLERPALRRLIPSRLSELTILDAGCGSGAQAQWLLENGADDVVGFD